ncbi:hypothetical protein [Siphonobacter aquaeclarae]|uniref:Uncharacterized protein n=1 Tax=Siphonobacter aquaeclarae TaxID=563176 RepID=A0A1G9T7W0_9BACT|nr:hypothetical protein [Siphonobacter aquaeclarae]SDM43761.1 hypothetical protein SAMN04488090_3449 [Siphonobacter aquaeclarae]
MKTFASIEEAFQWWLENIYPSLPPDVKKGKPVSAWRDYKHGGGVSEKRMKEILTEFGPFEIQTIITYKT